MEKTKVLTQWHPAFCSAVRLELYENKDDLQFETEYELNSKPIRVDMLVIRKSSEARIKSGIGKIFKGHNLFEYKSPEDKLNIDTFFKGIAYASLYKAGGTSVNSIKADDITLSFVKNSKPRNLFLELEKAGLTIKQMQNGIYYIQGMPFIDIQMIVTNELDTQSHIWLKSLTDDISSDVAEKFILTSSELKNKDSREYADSIMQIVLSKNKKVITEIKEVDSMCEALKELMRPEIEAEVDAAVKEKEAEYHATINEKNAEIMRLKKLLQEKQ